MQITMETMTLWQRCLDRLSSDVAIACINFGGNITSGVRTPEYNKKIGGVPTSWHLDGLAFDVKIDNPAPDIQQKFVSFLQLKGYRVLRSGSGNPGVFHVQFDWPVITGWKRENHLSHIRALIDSGYEIKQRHILI